MTDRSALVFLLDVDNTLFDNDRFTPQLPAPVPPDQCIARIGDLIDRDSGAFRHARHH